jgi:thioesterase domain-containing protein/acyl carrier protein
VLDPGGNRQPVGICGELYIGGTGVARGYLDAPELTERSFVPDPFHPGAGNRLYKTGDLAFCLPDGNAVLVGRSDRQVKIRGFRVELDEIESALARHPAVVQCAVRLDESGTSPKLVAYVSPRHGAEQSGSHLRAHMARGLPEHMIPAGFLFLPELPKTPSGKIDYRALPAADCAAWATDVVARQPSTSVELALAAIWEKVLGLAEIGAEANFFALGGDSLRASQLLLLIQEKFGREIPLSTLLRAPVLARLAAIVENVGDENLSAHASALVHLQPQGGLLPFFCISSKPDDAHGFRDLATQLGADQPFFAIANPIRENQSLNDVPDLARDAVSLLRGFRPRGPYLLGGYCLGGILAVEAARQLTARGEQVPLVVLLDTPAPGYPRALRRVAPYWRAFLRRTGGSSKFAIAQGGHFIPKRISVPVLQFDAYDVGILTRLIRVFVDARRGWRHVCAGDYETNAVTGSHSSMLRAPHVHETARRLRTVLQGINERFRAEN